MAEDQPAESASEHRWMSLFVVLSAAFMNLVDVSIVNVAIPSIQRDLHANYSEIELMISLYQLGYAVLLITGGRLGDIYGRKRLFFIGVLGFVAFSAACGAAPSAGILVISRFLQGLFAGLMYPQVMAVIQVSFPASERSRAFGILGAIIGIASITGPLLGGVLLQWNLFGLEWRPIFLINVVIGAVALLMAWKYLEESRAPRREKLDTPGVLIAAVTLFALIWPLSEARQDGWPWWGWVSLGASPACAWLFYRHERRRTDQRRFPLVNLELAKNPTFKLGLLVNLFFFLGVPSFFFVFMLYLQIGLHYSPLDAGLTLAPFAVFSASGSAASIRLLPRFGKKVLYAGVVLLAGGMGGVILAVQSASIALSGWDIAAPLCIAGAGLGVTVAPLVNIVLAGIESQEAGSASGVLTTFQRVGGSVGIAVVGVVFFGLVSGYAQPVVRAQTPQLVANLKAGGVPPGKARLLAQHFGDCFLRRSQSPNPTSSPPGCASQSDPSPAAAILARAARRALALDFTRALQWTFFFQIAVFALVLMLLLRMPQPPLEALGASSNSDSQT